MEERRKTTRTKANQLLSVLDRNHEKTLGHLVDISVDGFLLVSNAAIGVDAVWQLSIELPAEFNGSSAIQLGAESFWNEKTGEPPQYWTGFQIIDLAPEERENITRLIDQHFS